MEGTRGGVLALLAAATLTVAGAGVAGSRAADLAIACPKLSSASNLPRRPGGGMLRGDIDGDGARDRVTIRYAPRARASCGFFVVVEARRKTHAQRLPQWYKPPDDLLVREWTFYEPYVAWIVRLASDRAQVVVARGGGTALVHSVHGVVAGGLRELRFSENRRRSARLTLFGPTATTARCRWGGPLIVLSRGATTASGKRWRFWRIEYLLSGARFRLSRKRSIVVGRAQVKETEQRWGYYGSPFRGCTVSRRL